MTMDLPPNQEVEKLDGKTKIDDPLETINKYFHNCEIAPRESADSAVFSDFNSKLQRLILHPKYLLNLQPKLHVLGGRLGDFSLTKEDILSKISTHPHFKGGDEDNTPPESCKLAATVVRLLGTQLSKPALKKAAESCAHSAGAFLHLQTAKPNFGVFSNTAKIAESLAKTKKKTVLLSVMLSDLFVQRNPFTLSSFAHCFSVLIGPKGEGEGGFRARVYQAFGPPSIGYPIQTCLQSGSGSKDFSSKEWEAFKKNYETLENSKFWDDEVGKAYRAMFNCNLDLEKGYQIIPFTAVHSDVVDTKTVGCMFKILSCDY